MSCLTHVSRTSLPSLSPWGGLSFSWLVFCLQDVSSSCISQILRKNHLCFYFSFFNHFYCFSNEFVIPMSGCKWKIESLLFGLEDLNRCLRLTLCKCGLLIFWCFELAVPFSLARVCLGNLHSLRKMYCNRVLPQNLKFFASYLEKWKSRYFNLLPRVFCG